MRDNDAASIAERKVKDGQEELETSLMIGVPIQFDIKDKHVG